MYSHLEGKKLKMLNFEGGETTGLVVGCDEDVGITIVSAEDYNNYFLCLIGPLAPQWPGNTSISRFKYMFIRAVNLIKSGVFDGHEFLEYDATPSNPPPSIETCPFG